VLRVKEWTAPTHASGRGRSRRRSQLGCRLGRPTVAASASPRRPSASRARRSSRVRPRALGTYAAGCAVFYARSQAAYAPDSPLARSEEPRRPARWPRLALRPQLRRRRVVEQGVDTQTRIALPSRLLASAVAIHLPFCNGLFEFLNRLAKACERGFELGCHCNVWFGHRRWLWPRRLREIPSSVRGSKLIQDLHEQRNRLIGAFFLARHAWRLAWGVLISPVGAMRRRSSRAS
jgi:hypothetical protein